MHQKPDEEKCCVSGVEDKGIDLFPDCRPPWLARNGPRHSCRSVSPPSTSSPQRPPPRTLPAGFHHEPGGRGAARGRTRTGGAGSLVFRPGVAAGQRLEPTMQPVRFCAEEGVLACFVVFSQNFERRSPLASYTKVELEMKAQEVVHVQFLPNWGPYHKLHPWRPFRSSIGSCFSVFADG